MFPPRSRYVSLSQEREREGKGSWFFFRANALLQWGREAGGKGIHAAQISSTWKKQEKAKVLSGFMIEIGDSRFGSTKTARYISPLLPTYTITYCFDITVACLHVAKMTKGGNRFSVECLRGNTFEIGGRDYQERW